MSLASVAPNRFALLLGNRDLVLLLAAGLVSQVGDWILDTGVAFEVYALTGSTVASAGVLLATLVPQVLLSSAAGSLVDRWDRRRTMIVADAVLALILLPLLLVRDGDQVWIVLAVVAVSSCVLPFFLAAEASLLPAVVPEELLVTANALNGQVRQVARLVGAGLGGLAAVGGFALIAVADLGTFVLAAILLLLIRHRAAPPATVRVAGPRWSAGLAAIVGSRALRVLLVFSVLAGAGEGVMGTLFAPFVRDVLGGTAAAYGGILAAQAVGGIVGGLIVTLVGHRVRPWLLLGGGGVLFGLLDLALFLSPLVTSLLWPAAVLIAVVGVPAAALSAGLATVFQRATRDEDRGAVFGALLSAGNASTLGGTVLAGLLAAPLGVLPVIVAQGVLQLVGGLVVLASSRRVAT